MSSDSDVVVLQKNNSVCKIHLFGATLISWTCNDNEYIFVSSKAKFDNKTAIRGGIPVVFPNFGPWTLGPQHGFARTSRWTIDQVPTEDNNNSGDIRTVLSLEDNVDTRKMWNDNRFKLSLTVTLSDDHLKMELDVENKGSTPFSFTCLLHTYFRVPDVHNSTVSNLKGLSYVDKIKGGTFTEDRDPLALKNSTDSIYKDTPTDHKIVNVTGNKSILLQKENLPDTVIWNPWEEKAKQMGDLGSDYINMLCVEAGHVSNSVDLAANGKFHASQTFTLV